MRLSSGNSEISDQEEMVLISKASEGIPQIPLVPLAADANLARIPRLVEVASSGLGQTDEHVLGLENSGPLADSMTVMILRGNPEWPHLNNVSFIEEGWRREVQTPLARLLPHLHFLAVNF